MAPSRRPPRESARREVSMKNLFCVLFLSGSLSTGFAATSPASSADGVWDAVVVVNKMEIPFRMEFSQKGKSLSGAFLNGDVKESSTSGEMDGGKLHLHFDYWNSDLRASLNGGKLEGTY